MNTLPRCPRPVPTPSRCADPDDVGRIDAIVVPGGESTTIGKLLVTFGVLEPLRDALAAGLPAYGSCAGMILPWPIGWSTGRPTRLEARAGIDMTVRRNAFGRQVDSFEGPVCIAGVGEIEAVFIRAPWAEQVGDGVEVLGRAGGW